MSSIKTALSLLKTPGKMIFPIADKGLLNWIPDEQYLKLAYRMQMGKKLDLKNPQTFNEKLQWLKLNNRKPIYKRMVDKYEVKQYVSSIIGNEYIIPTIGLWENVKDIDLNSLPRKFVLKCTHDSGSVIVCKDKDEFNWEAAKVKLQRHLTKNIYWFGREWPYKNLKPRIIAEPLLEDSINNEVRDYKLFCFNGIVRCFKIDFDRFIEHHANYYDRNDNLLKIGEEICPPVFDKLIYIPKEMPSLIKLAEKLSASIPFLRADFYVVDGKVYFGELTFYPASGFGPFIFDGNDELLGSWLRLPVK